MKEQKLTRYSKHIIKTIFAVNHHVSPYKNQKISYLSFKIRRKETFYWRIVMELECYQAHIIGNYQENTLKGTGVQASFLHTHTQKKWKVFLIISCSISKLLTEILGKSTVFIIHSPMTHRAHYLLATHMNTTDFLAINYKYIPVEG